MRLLFFAGSTREGSFNKKLARLAQHISTANGIEGVFVDLRDYPMPLYSGDLEVEHGGRGDAERVGRVQQCAGTP